MAWYRAGTVGVTNGSTTVALSGGNALANIFPGDSFLGPDGRAYEVALVTSATSFTLATAYQGATATGQPYAIQPTGSTGALRLLNDQVSDLVTNYQTGRDAWASAPASTLKGRKGGGAGAVENLTPADVLALLSGGTPGALTGAERLPVLQGESAVGLTVNQLLSRASGQALPFEIGGVRVGTVTQTGVGLGTTTPEAALHLRKDAAATGIGTNPLIILQNSGGASFGERTEIHFRQSGQAIAAISASYTSYSSGQYGGELVFATKSHANSELQERMTLDRDGRVLIGKGKSDTGVAGCEIHPQGGFIASRSDVSLNLTRLDNTGPVAVFRSHGTGVVGSVSVTATSTAYNTSSDYRLKGEFTEINPLSALERVKQLRPGRFPWLATGEVVDGFLAHEVQEVVPESVTGEKDGADEIGDATGYREHDPETGVPILTSKETLTGITQAECPEGYTWVKTGARPVYQGIDQSKLVPLLAAGLKAAIGEIEALQARVAALESAA